MPAPLAAFKLAVDPEGFFASNAARLGETYRIALPGIGEVLVSGEPEAARELFSAPPETFTPLDVNPVEPLLGEHSLLLLHGERHRRERKLMMPSFSGDRMRLYGAIMCDAAREEATSWRAGSRVELAQAMRNVTLGVILGAVLGVDVDDDRPVLRRAVAASVARSVAASLVASGACAAASRRHLLPLLHAASCCRCRLHACCCCGG
jgi:cytochrome P450